MKSKKRFQLLQRFFILTFFLFFNLSILSAVAQDGNDSPLQEGQIYEIKFGLDKLIGTAKLQYQNGVYLLDIPLAFVGAGTFGRITKSKLEKEIPKVKYPEYDFKKEYFTPFNQSKYSFNDTPILKEKILELVKEIQKNLSTDYFKLKITTIFPDESQYLSADQISEKNYNLYQYSLFSDVAEGIKGQFHAVPIFILAHPNVSVMTPTLWDIYSDPLLQSHEVGHLLRIRTEGYQLINYPPHGIMNDQTNFNLVKMRNPNIKFGITRTDFNEMMTNLLKTAVPAIDQHRVETYFTPTNQTFYKANENYPIKYKQFYGPSMQLFAEEKYGRWQGIVKIAKILENICR